MNAFNDAYIDCKSYIKDLYTSFEKIYTSETEYCLLSPNSPEFGNYSCCNSTLQWWIPCVPRPQKYQQLEFRDSTPLMHQKCSNLECATKQINELIAIQNVVDNPILGCGLASQDQQVNYFIHFLTVYSLMSFKNNYMFHTGHVDDHILGIIKD